MPKEGHFINRSNWLRAAVLGANDGIVSSASLLVGVSAAGMTQGNVLLTGLAGLTAGALSMAAGEYVSVSAQADVEKADLERERVALIEDPDYELSELAEGLENRGVQSDLALEVATQMTDHDALGAHAREELGMFGLAGQADPLQAAGASALAFALGGGLPLFAAVLAPAGLRGVTIALVALLALILLGAGGAQLGGAPKRPAIGRVLCWGGLAMAVTAGVGHLFGAIG
ncbi:MULTISPECIES: VIT family protein [Sulfitobacter]|uniref:VIT1/CCC1 transporter family protein n=1 Tax=Sulfitobacter TaxID=60136 RepID=UPI0023079F64|nr:MULTISPECIES: VIT family protein [Sulfitobacter]MDF3382493.1 VIT family protein [Sulfitobacter sp. Ks11]MDF3385912.1 VIT family protein [Sulfitobacter sp. M85]MDF3389331.1 VIT family protein [Sulfitobacter sp. Ks16]MDF3399968.1 VIT family protein [Sulfitobacter sp. KE39]MDF3403389.1 VIT family protein [Sulfitobacter sp. Ks35]